MGEGVMASKSAAGLKRELANDVFAGVEEKIKREWSGVEISRSDNLNMLIRLQTNAGPRYFNVKFSELI
jgi:hypothetical protein